MRFGMALGWMFVAAGAWGQGLSLPPRPANTSHGSVVSRAVADLPLLEREARLEAEVLRGNVPDFLRRFRPVSVTNINSGRTNIATFFAAPDYLAVGSDEDYFLTPLRPETAQRIGDALGCSLPTRAMVDAIYAAAAVKLEPHPMTPGATMTTVPVFAQHNSIVRKQRLATLAQHPAGALVAGHKKDVVLSNRLTNAPGKVAIYGWHKPDGKAIQPLYLGHTSAWVDYSHGIRLVATNVIVNGKASALADVLRDQKLAALLSDEGPMAVTGYALPTVWKTNAAFNERTLTLPLRADVRAQINEPLPLKKGKPLHLILYALPNGNTIEQTAGHRLAPGEDWHFDIQHIAAQTRFLRAADTNGEYVVAYLEAGNKSWPAWRKSHRGEGSQIRGMVEELTARYTNQSARVTLSGHSGGGSFIFGYFGAVEEIPTSIERIAFLDSTYAYDTEQHATKLMRWLKSPTAPALCVLAYDDANGLLNGKPFVSHMGGTWFRSQLMQTNLASAFTFTRETRSADDSFPGALHRVSAGDGRVIFWLKENPARKIFHTVQVERNGFIEAMLSGTPLHGRGYEYFGVIHPPHFGFTAETQGRGEKGAKPARSGALPCGARTVCVRSGFARGASGGLSRPARAGALRTGGPSAVRWLRLA